MASLTPAAVQNENLHIQRGKGVEGSEFGVIQNENLHILKGKAVDGAKSGIIQNENLHILKGKGVEGFKAEVPKPAKAGHQERKALRDLSQARKPVLSAANKATALKDKPTAAIRETAKKAPKSYILTDEEMSKCREWAKEGIEHMHFSGNDMQKFEARQQEERVRKKVDKAMSALREWTDMTFGLEIPVKEVPSDTEDTLQLKFEPEVLPPTPRARLPKKSGYEEICELLELDYDSIYFDRQIEIKLKEECEALDISAGGEELQESELYEDLIVDSFAEQTADFIHFGKWECDTLGCRMPVHLQIFH